MHVLYLCLFPLAVTLPSGHHLYCVSTPLMRNANHLHAGARLHDMGSGHTTDHRGNCVAQLPC